MLLATIASGLSNVRTSDAAANANGVVDAQAIARKRLVEHAREVIQGGPFGSLESARESVDSLRVAVREAQASAAATDTLLWARLSWLLGLDEVPQGQPGPSAALLEIVWFNRWLAGEETGGRYALRPRGARDDIQSPVLLDEVAWKDLDADERGRLLRDRVVDLARLGDVHRAPPEQLELTAAPAQSPLQEAASQLTDPLSRWREPVVLENVPLFTHEDELADETSEKWIRVRESQVQVRLEAWEEETASGLITQTGMVRHTQRVEAIHAELARLNRRKQAVVDRLDRLVSAEMDVNRYNFLLDNKIQDAKNLAGVADTRAALGRLRLEEILARLEEQILYLTVLRAQQRLLLYERARQLIQEEVVAAETAQARLQQQLGRARRALEIERLAQDRSWFEANRKQAQERIARAAEADQAVWQNYVDILDDLLKMNGLLEAIVRLRQSLEARVQVDVAEAAQMAAATDAAAETPALPSDAGQPASPSLGEVLLAALSPSEVAQESATDAMQRERLGILLQPERYVHLPGFVTVARSALDDPSFGAGLVANTFAAVDDYIQRRRLAVDESMRAEGLQAQFESVAMTISPRLAAVAGKLPPYMAWDVQQIREQGQTYDKLLQRTIAGIREERKLTREQIAAHEALREALMGLGQRSLENRVDRSLDAKGLGAAQTRVFQLAIRVVRWITLSEPPHMGTFVAAFWPQIAMALLLGLSLIAGVSYGRRRIDRALERMGRRIPELRGEAITLGVEAEQERQARVSERDAARQAEATVLRESSLQGTDETESDTADAENVQDNGRGGTV